MIRQFFCWLWHGHDWQTVASNTVRTCWVSDRVLRGFEQITSRCSRCGKLRFEERLGVTP